MDSVNVYQKRVRFLELWYSSFWGECENVFMSINNSCILLGRNIQDFCNCCLEIQLHGRSVSMHCYWGGRLCPMEAIASAKRDRRLHFVKCSPKLSKPANHISTLLTWLPLGSGPGERSARRRSLGCKRRDLFLTVSPCCLLAVPCACEQHPAVLPRSEHRFLPEGSNSLGSFSSTRRASEIMHLPDTSWSQHFPVFGGVNFCSTLSLHRASKL